jgi:acyl-CoA synthetase (AMP-forming)/AMP-acid ligase II/acyl carrier protein
VSPGRPDSTLVDLVSFRAADAPGRTAYSFLRDGEELEAGLTYAELDRRARGVAELLSDRGARGRPVLLLYPPGLDYVAGFFGCLYAGALAVPAYPPRPNRSADRLASIVGDAEPVVALTTARLLDRTRARLRETAPALAVLATDDARGDREPAEADPGAVAFLQYTSGSSADPKGVAVTHANLMHNVALMARTFELGGDERIVSWLPPYHDMGLIGGILCPLFCGAPAVLMAPAAFLQRPLRWLEAISRERATSSAAPNFAYDLCARQIAPEDRGGLDLSSWRLACCGAEPIRADTLHRFAEAFAPHGFDSRAFAPSYGLAEATLLVSARRPGTPPAVGRFGARALEENRVVVAAGEPERALVSCGSAPPGVRVAIVDPDSRELCPAGRVGEIWTASESVARGYHRRPEESAATFAARVAGGDETAYLRTGDLGFVHDGEIFVAGRIKDLIVLRGRNIYPQDVERTAQSAHPALSLGASAAFSVAGADGEALVVVQEIPRRFGPADAELVARAVRRAVAEWHDVEPHAVVLVKPLGVPKTSSGKIQRSACRDRYLRDALPVVARWTAAPPKPAASGARRDERLAGIGGAPPEREAIRRALRALLADLLEVDPSAIDPQEPLAAHGIDSLKAVAFASEIQARLGFALSVTLLWEYPTLDALADYIACVLSPAAPRGVVPAARDEGVPVIAKRSQAS